MIYPPKFTTDNTAERKVYEVLAKLPDADFTTFYNQQFTSVHPRERNEYEIDFIIADHRNNKLNAILIIEVKGGSIQFDGVHKVWSQNGNEMKRPPNDQVSYAMNSLVKRFQFLSYNVPFHWILWFPDVEISEKEWLPTNISKDRLLGANALTYAKEAISHIASDVVYKANRQGGDIQDFNKLRDLLLRSAGFFKPLHKEFEENELTFNQLTEKQSKIFKYIDQNQNICVQGPAGSGKTFIAYNKAIEYAEQGLKVLFVCFNKALATELRNRFRSNTKISPQDFHIEFTNFHFWALRLAEKNPTYVKEKSSDEFFNTYIPNKAKEIIQDPEYDVLIIDEGQDFRENWIDVLNKGLKKDGRFLFFMDENQDIFHKFKGIPHHRNLTKCALEENCRNTKEIITYLKNIAPQASMIPMEKTPDGQPVKIINVNNNEDQIKYLDTEIRNLLNQGISPHKMVILTNNLADQSSSLKGIKELGGNKLISTYDREYGRDLNCIVHTTINVFKGLEADVLFLLDCQNITNENSFYTQVSRAKQLITLFHIVQ